MLFEAPKVLLKTCFLRIFELSEVSSTLAHPEPLSSLMAYFQQDLQSGILRLFQIKRLIHGNTSTNKALGKTGEKKLSTIPWGWKGKTKPGTASGHSNAVTQCSAEVKEEQLSPSGDWITGWLMRYHKSALMKRHEEEEGSLYSRFVWLCCSSSFPPALWV